MSMALDPATRYDMAAVTDRDNDIALRNRADEALVSQAITGNADAFEELVRRYRNEVYALSYHFVKNREDAWDISQEVFIKAYRSLSSFRGDAGFKTWLMRITANHCKDTFKKRKVATVPLMEEEGAQLARSEGTPEHTAHAGELGAAIDKAVDSLPPKHKMAFVLREYEDLSYQEMAEVMQCSMGTVMSRLHHARKKLQQALRDSGVLEGGYHGD
ncbi:MAG: sigma-70 family RNA polymerase sigma factor [Candidatus Hydrogenedens sp.]|nr:sigma-70 family RNA polymerase sigma factor [Candidatus Hydrogenedens sp.]